MYDVKLMFLHDYANTMETVFLPNTKIRLVLSGRSFVSLAHVFLISFLLLTAPSVLLAVIKNNMSVRQVSLFRGSMNVLNCLEKYLNF